MNERVMLCATEEEGEIEGAKEGVSERATELCM